MSGLTVLVPSVCYENRVIIIQHFEMRFTSGIALRYYWPETILNTLALDSLFLSEHFDWSTACVASLRYLKVFFVWQIVRFFVLGCNFLDRVTKFSGL
jgi:hypothetical protein